METYRIYDALTEATVEIDYPGLTTRIIGADGAGAAPAERVSAVVGFPAEGAGEGAPVRGLFYPGCSVINHALPLIPLLYGMLAEAGVVDGMSVLCCGRILDFEKGTEARHNAFNNAFTDAVAQHGVERVITACPNCAETLAQVLAADPRTEHVKVQGLPGELARLGYRLDPERIDHVTSVKQQMLDDEKLQQRLIDDAIDEIYARAAGEVSPEDASELSALDAAAAEALGSAEAAKQLYEALSNGEATAEAVAQAEAELEASPVPTEVPLWVHRSCPDMETLMFARGVIDLAPEGWVLNTDLKATGCCGAKAQAVGRFDVAERQAQGIAARAHDAGARAIVAACMSCTTSLASSQLEIPIIHYLEYLFDWPIDWRAMQPGVAFRFLIEDDEQSAAGRQFIGLPKAPKRAED